MLVYEIDDQMRKEKGGAMPSSSDLDMLANLAGIMVEKTREQGAVIHSSNSTLSSHGPLQSLRIPFLPHQVAQSDVGDIRMATSSPLSITGELVLFCLRIPIYPQLLSIRSRHYCTAWYARKAALTPRGNTYVHRWLDT